MKFEPFFVQVIFPEKCPEYPSTLDRFIIGSGDNIG